MGQRHQPRRGPGIVCPGFQLARIQLVCIYLAGELHDQPRQVVHELAVPPAVFELFNGLCGRGRQFPLADQRSLEAVRAAETNLQVVLVQAQFLQYTAAHEPVARQ